MTTKNTRAAFLVVALGAALCITPSASQQPPRSTARSFYVSPAGRAQNDGSTARPIDFATALSQKGPVRPGDTVWLRGGTYRGNFVSTVEGQPDRPIIFRAQPGERATLDGVVNSPVTVLTIRGANVWFWGIEVTNSNPRRWTNSTGSNPPDRRGLGVEIYAAGARLINSVVHDTGTGIGVWKTALGAEVYGNIVYYNGWRAPDRAHGHGLYVQNELDTLRLVDNVIFNQFVAGIQAYGSAAAFLNNIHIEGNTVFSNGSLAMEVFYERNILVGGDRRAERPTLLNNATYHPPRKGGANHVGYNAGCISPTLEGNYFVGGQALVFTNCSDINMTGNTLLGAFEDRLPSKFPDNTYLTEPPDTEHVIVRPNRYEPGRAYVTVYNWPRRQWIDVDLRGVMQTGARYEVRNVQTFWDSPVGGGTYNGGGVRLLMDSTKVSLPTGLDSGPPSTAPEFQTLVIAPLGSIRR
jgi:hypothetical protein